MTALSTSHQNFTMLGFVCRHASTSGGKRSGYKEMVLDTLIPMKAAIGLYKKNGFKECEPYYSNPMADVIYMMKELK